MEEKAFNLIDEAWICVLRPDGKREEVSLKEALLEAHRYADLGGEMQAQNVAILRLLLAILHTVFSRVDESGAAAPFSRSDDALKRWKMLFDRGSLPEKPITEYLETWRERFWLFHPEYPFGQALSAREGTQCAAAKLIGELSESGNKARLFAARAQEGKTQLSFAEAARWLLYLNGFDDAALKPHIPKEQREGGISVAWLGKLGLVVAKGKTLFETLLLNLVLLREDGTLWGENRPVWECENPPQGELRKIPLPDNQAELLTLQSRRIWLRRENGFVTSCGILCGDAFDSENAFTEQMTVWGRKEEKNQTVFYYPRPHQANRQLWRDFANIFMPSEQVRLPGVVRWVEALKQRERYGFLQRKRYIQFAAVCNRYDSSQKSAVTDTLGDTLTFHTALLEELGRPWQHRIADEIAHCERVAWELGLLAERIVQAGGGSGEQGKQLAGEAAWQWYAGLDLPFRRWLASIDPECDTVGGEKLEQWVQMAYQLALRHGRALMEQAGTAALFGRVVEEKIGKTKTEKRLYAAPRAFSWFQKQVWDIYWGA